MTRWHSEEGCMHAMFGAGALVLVLVVLLILILTAALPLPPSAQFGGVDPAWAVGLLLLAIILGGAAGALLGGWRVRLPLARANRLPIKPEALTDSEMRRKFERMLGYRQGISEAAQAVGNGEPRRLLAELVAASEKPLRRLFQLAKEVENSQSRLLRSDLVRLWGKMELSAAEREQLGSLERLDALSRLGGGLIDDTLAILGRCYAESRELALARNLAEGDALRLMNGLRDQATLLGDVAEALWGIHEGRR